MQDRPKKILFIIHRLYFEGVPKKGGIDRIVEYLGEKNHVDLIEHPFEKINHPSQFSGSQKNFHGAKTRPPLLWIEECVINIWWILQTKKTYDLAIASDPLNFFSCHILKVLGKVKKTQFHSTDYSCPRFANLFLESIYQWLYRFAVKHADFTTVVSEKMRVVALQFIDKNNVYLLPNSPEFDAIPKVPINERRKNELVLLVGRWGNQINTEQITACMKKLCKKNEKIKLNIIGFVDKRYQKILTKHVRSAYIFHGSISYQKAMQITANCFIGITAYKEMESYVHFADSLKIREYAAAGLPIVCDTIYATASEVQKEKAGYVYKTTDEMIAAIIRLLENKKEYETMSNNAILWAKKNDKRKLLKSLYRNYDI